MTLSEIRSRARLLNPEATSTVISDANILTIINAGALDVALRTKGLITYADHNVTSGRRDYNLPDDCVELLYVLYGGTGEWEKLAYTTETWLDQNMGEWRDDTGTIEAYYRRGNTIGLYKEPTSEEAGSSYLRTYYIEKPDEMSADGDDPFNSNNMMKPYHHLVSLYVRYHLKEMLGFYQQAATLENKYIIGCNQAMINLTHDSDFRQPIRPYYRGGAAKSQKQNPLDL